MTNPTTKMALPDQYYPQGLNPIHPVMDWAKVRRLARAALRGDDVRPILVEGENLLAGTHRAAANDILDQLGHGRLIDVVELEDVVEYPEDYGIDADDARAIVSGAEDGDYEAIDQIWDRTASA